MSASVPADSAPEPSGAEASAEAAAGPGTGAVSAAEPSPEATEQIPAVVEEEESSSPFRRRRDRPGLGWLGWVVIGVPTAVMGVGWAIIMAHVGQTPGLAVETRAVDLRDNAAVVTYAVGKPKDEQVRCVVDAYDDKLNVLAQREITVPKGAAKVTAQETLETPRKATGGRIRDCHTT
ncbi:DUF4307 domain-containing protein [Actinomadura harenae]|uniref:DUF4307 domain-containing protein n=1 Tax=Actinomadura harenae TaxID=2483351 RepID=A0A3M2M7L1_9ACTN|nr:DUF4307 domain-containing protein [Actinomadura harenae]RMI44525.1 DUF4307 domain-containing protein [Actinomadura harenae]